MKPLVDVAAMGQLYGYVYYARKMRGIFREVTVLRLHSLRPGIVVYHLSFDHGYLQLVQ